jgi:hypothetical protein
VTVQLSEQHKAIACDKAADFSNLFINFFIGGGPLN